MRWEVACSYTVTKTVIIEADSEEEADREARREYYQYSLDATDDFSTLESSMVLGEEEE